MNVVDLVEKLNKEEILQTDCLEEMGFPFFDDECSWDWVASDLDVEKHRWYETAISVFISDTDDCIGIRHVTHLYNENSSFDDVCHILKFYVMKPKTITTYEIVS